MNQRAFKALIISLTLVIVIRILGTHDVTFGRLALPGLSPRLPPNCCQALPLTPRNIISNSQNNLHPKKYPEIVGMVVMLHPVYSKSRYK